LIHLLFNLYYATFKANYKFVAHKTGYYKKIIGKLYYKQADNPNDLPLISIYNASKTVWYWKNKDSWSFHDNKHCIYTSSYNHRDISTIHWRNKIKKQLKEMYLKAKNENPT